MEQLISFFDYENKRIGLALLFVGLLHFLFIYVGYRIDRFTDANKDIYMKKFSAEKVNYLNDKFKENMTVEQWVDKHQHNLSKNMFMIKIVGSIFIGLGIIFLIN